MTFIDSGSEPTVLALGASHPSYTINCDWIISITPSSIVNKSYTVKATTLAIKIPSFSSDDPLTFSYTISVVGYSTIPTFIWISS
jgi:hypothetical protein